MGAAMIKKHLPENIADTPDKRGIKPVPESYSINLSQDVLFPRVGVFAPTTEAEEQDPIFLPNSENRTDVFALERKVKSYVLFRDTSNYDLAESQWSYQVSDSTSSDTLPPGVSSVVWTERINARASYPGTLAEVKFSPNESAVRLICYPVSNNLGLQQATLYSNRFFSAAANPIMATMAVKMTLSDNPNCSKTWGLFGGNSGYFFRIKGNGLGNNFMVGYRRTLGGSTNEVTIPRNSFNGDKLDGSGVPHVQTFTNVGMFGVEVGTAGYGARFWAYVQAGTIARWVLVHSVNNDSGSSQSRIVDEEGLPISFMIENPGASNDTQTLNKYGTSVTSIGSPSGSPEINSISSAKTIYPSRTPFPILGIKATTYINSIKNFSSILLTSISIFANNGLWRIVLIKNPSVDPTNSWININSLSAIQYNLNRGLFLSGGVTLASFLVSANKPLTISMKKIFDLNRTFLTAQYTNDTQAPGDFGEQFLASSDELWLCAVDANIPFTNDEIIWDSPLTTSAVATYQNTGSESLSDLITTINASLNTLEV
jgi:hypothetical protein